MPTYKGIEIPANNADKIGAMIESAKNRLMDSPVGDIMKGAAGIGATRSAALPAVLLDTGANAIKAIPKIGLGAIGAITGLEAPKTPDYNMSATDKVMELGDKSVSSLEKGIGAIGQNIREGLKGFGFTEPISSAPNLGAVKTTTVDASKTAPAAPVIANGGATTLADKPVSRPEGDPNFFFGGTTFQPSAGFGARPSDTKWTDKDLAEWKARGIATGNHGVLEGREGLDLTAADRAFIASVNSNKPNPNDERFAQVADKIKDISTFLSSDPLTRKYQIQELGALKGVLGELGPLTSFGNFGVAGMHDETTQRGQDLMAETTRRGQDTSAETAAGLQGIYKDKNAMDALYQSGLLEQGKEKIGMEKLKVDAKTPENFLKLATTIAPKIKATDPATGNEIETHDLQQGIKMLTASGFETPKGFKMPVNGGPSLPDFLVAAKKKGTKLSDEQLTQYYNENYGKGR